MQAYVHEDIFLGGAMARRGGAIEISARLCQLGEIARQDVRQGRSFAAQFSGQFVCQAGAATTLRRASRTFVI